MKNNSRADYSYWLIEFAGRNVMVIIDEAKGNRSVTNAIKQVVKEIGATDNVDPDHYMIVYRDSECMWDGFDSKRNTFIPLQCNSREEAIRKYVDLQLSGTTRK